ncbi:MAG TPA: aldo/keto reductase [Streptosporangiales bacterium]
MTARPDAASPRLSRIGLGLAAVGRPAYITVGRSADLPTDRSVPALRTRAFELLDLAYAHGIRYVDAARSYGRAEEFLGQWLARRPDADVVVGSKWGYTYVGDWRMDAEVHEIKDHSLAAFERQYAETRALLGDRVAIYQVHSATLESGVLDDGRLHRALARLRDEGIRVGLTTSGPGQRDTVRKALDIQVDGVPLFGCVQATWNVLETSVGPALADAHDAGWIVIVKEAVANGRITAAGDVGGPGSPLATAASELDTTPDALAIAAALAQPWATVVLSGAVTTGQLLSNLAALDVRVQGVPALAEEPTAYWSRRAARPWR